MQGPEVRRALLAEVDVNLRHASAWCYEAAQVLSLQVLSAGPRLIDATRAPVN